MLRSRPSRLVTTGLLVGLFAWNAPAMAVPALIQWTKSCAEPRPVPAHPATPAPAAHQHHAGMRHERAMPVAAPVQRNVQDCFQQHTCCSFNREPGKKSEAVSLADAQAAARPAPAVVAREREGVASAEARPPIRAVFDLKSDMRI
ncbi:MAG TPA: hypothetical protein VLA96_07265 [Terriglobales bacterium]|nr:hypothetical protein [Terriglobales bacterium]